MLADVKTTAGVVRVPKVVLNQAIEAIKANQHTDGGWTWEKAAGSETALKKAAEPDMTGAAMAALCTAGVASTESNDRQRQEIPRLGLRRIDRRFQIAVRQRHRLQRLGGGRPQSLRLEPAGIRIHRRRAGQKDTA